MKAQVTYHRHEPNTVNGEVLEVKIFYTSFDKTEIDNIEKQYKESVGYALIIDEGSGHDINS